MRIVHAALFLVALLIWPCLSPVGAQQGNNPPPQQPPGAAQPAPVPGMPTGEQPPEADPNLVFPYLVAFLLTASILLLVCMPSRKAT